MNSISKNDKYKESLDSLVGAIERGDVKKIDKQYNEITNGLSKTFESLIGKAEDIAKYVVRGDLDNYVRLLNKKQSNFKIFRRVLNKISGRDTQIKNISDFVSRLPYPTIETAIEHLKISGKILRHEVNCESRTTFEQKEDIALFTIIRTDRNMLLACYSHKHISYRIRTIIRKAILLSYKKKGSQR